MLTGSLPEQVDHRKLAAEKVRLEGSIPVAAFERLCGLLEDTRGEVEVRLQFRKGKKHRVFVAGTCSGEVTLLCQACLEPVSVKVEAPVSTLLVESVGALMALPQEEDGLVSEGKYVALADLVEDDLILSLPMVPRHDEGQCGLVKPTGEPPRDETYRPFAGLAGLDENFKRS